MLFNTSTTGDPRSFFYYKGDYYINGTEIILKDSYIKNHTWNGQKLWKYALYDHQTTYNGQTCYFFRQSRCDGLSLNSMGLDANERSNYAPYFLVSSLDLESAIGEIAHAIKLERAQTEAIIEAVTQPKSEFDNNIMLVLWAVYIIAMFGSLIFKQFYILWAIESFLFFKFRKEMLR